MTKFNLSIGRDRHTPYAAEFSLWRQAASEMSLNPKPVAALLGPGASLGVCLR